MKHSWRKNLVINFQTFFTKKGNFISKFLFFNLFVILHDSVAEALDEGRKINAKELINRNEKNQLKSLNL